LLQLCCIVGSGEEDTDDNNDECADPIINLVWVLQQLPHLHMLIVQDGGMLEAPELK
jgi:hypothetical protein